MYLSLGSYRASGSVCLDAYNYRFLSLLTTRSRSCAIMGNRVVDFPRNNISFDSILFASKPVFDREAGKAFPACSETSGLLVRKFFKGAWPLLIPGLCYPYAPSHFSFPLSLPPLPSLSPPKILPFPLRTLHLPCSPWRTLSSWPELRRSSLLSFHRLVHPGGVKASLVRSLRLGSLVSTAVPVIKLPTPRFSRITWMTLPLEITLIRAPE